jgi:hypothetical protein
MNRSTLLALASLAPALVAVGCGCNQEYSFPEPEGVQFPDPPPDFGSHLSFGVAPDGRRVTMTYYDRVTEGIGFATGRFSESGELLWRHEQVDGYPEEDGLDRGDRGRYTSHLVTPEGMVIVAYQDSSNGQLKAAERLGPNNWESMNVDAGLGETVTDAGNWASIGLLSDGTAVIAHFDEAAGVLRFSRRAANGWVNETAWAGEGEEAVVGSYADLLVKDDVVYIAFYNVSNGNLELVEGGEGNWSHSTIDSIGNVGQWPSLLTTDDELLVAYHDVGNQDLKLGRRALAGGGWNLETIDRGEYRGADTELFLRDGLPHIVYFDGRDNNIVHAGQGTDGAWSIQTIAGGDRAVGFYNEVVEVGGRVIVGSFDHTNSALFTTELFPAQ